MIGYMRINKGTKIISRDRVDRFKIKNYFRIIKEIMSESKY